MRPEGGVNGSQLKLSRTKSLAQDPSVHPNPRVLDEVWSSYVGATPTQESPRNPLDQTRK